MAHRGSQALGEIEWQRREYADGVRAGLNGWRDLHSNCHYQKGYRRGVARRIRDTQPESSST